MLRNMKRRKIKALMFESFQNERDSQTSGNSLESHGNRWEQTRNLQRRF